MPLCLSSRGEAQNKVFRLSIDCSYLDYYQEHFSVLMESCQSLICNMSSERVAQNQLYCRTWIPAGTYAESATAAAAASSKHIVYWKTHGYTQSENQEDELLSGAVIESLSN
jgi:hypothetical protein